MGPDRTDDQVLTGIFGGTSSPQPAAPTTDPKPEPAAQAAPAAAPAAMAPAKPDTPADTKPAADPPKKLAGKYEKVEDLEKGYTEAQRTMTQRAQEASAAKKRIADLEAQLTAQQKPARTPEQIEADKAALMDRFYEDPEAVVAELAEKRAQEIIAPYKPTLEQQREQQRINSEVAEFFQENPHALDVQPEMTELVKDPGIAMIVGKPGWLEALHSMALRVKVTPAPAAAQGHQAPAVTRETQQAQKAAAAISSGGAPPGPGEDPNSDEAVVRKIFGTPGKRLMFDP